MDRTPPQSRLMPPDLPDPARKLPERFGRYLLIQKIGSGGMAEVFRAVTFGWEGFRRVIVVKRIRRELSDSPNFLSMFFDEAKISALLHHPNVVQVYDFGQVDGAYFLAMEHIDGKDLGGVLRALRAQREHLSPSLVAHIGHEVALGLHYAHTLHDASGRRFDIVHRDINPSNVMLVRTGGVKVLDFGIAKASEAAGKTQTQRAMLKGKLSYVSPEQARCEPLDARSDIFSWGSTMWELLTGHRLFGGRSDYDRLQAVKRAPVMAPSRHRPEVPLALDRIVLKALERDPAKRYQTAAQVAADLDTFLRVAPPDPDAIPRLLSELFGDESASNVGLLDGDGTNSDLSGGVSYTGSSSNAGQERSTLVEDSEAEDGEAAPAHPRATLWAIGAALVVAIVAIVSWSLRASPGAPAAAPSPGVMGTGTASPAASRAAAPGLAPAAKVVKIDVDSEPEGAVVTGSDGPLGKTPLTITLPTSRELELLRFEKPGYHPLTYEVRPESAGVVFVELRRAK